MSDLDTFLCVVDPTADTQPAVQRAAAIAAEVEASLELLVCDYNEYLSGERLFDSPTLEKARSEILEGYENFLDSLAAPLRERGIDVRTRAIWAHPLYEGIVRHAAAINADLVFKDTHHHSAIARALLSHTDWNLIRSCASPLWLVKPREMKTTPLFLAALDPMNEHDKPAALDDQILELAKSLAGACDGDLHAFHSFDPRVAMAPTANAYIPVSLPMEDLAESMREQHEKRFTELMDFHGIAADRAHLVAGVAHRELPKLAEKLDASVVVMGAVARNRLQRLFIGSTAERTLEHLPCDLLIVKPAWFEAPLDDRA